jgi:N-acetylmuramoyl-L-alanine amidase
MSNCCRSPIPLTCVTVFACLVNLSSPGVATACARASAARFAGTRPARIETVRVDGHGRTTTLRVRATRPCRVIRTRLRQPERLVLDFSPARWGGTHPVRQGKGTVRTVRIAQHDGRRVRLVVDTEPHATRWNGRFRGGEWVGHGRSQETTREAKRMHHTRRPQEASSDHSLRALRRLVIGIDPGHGGEDPGAIAGSGLEEKKVTLGIARQLRRLLKRQGIRTVMTRTDDRRLPKESRIAFVSNGQANLIISIHCDALDGSPHCTGITTYYHGGSRRSQELAEALQQRLTLATRLPSRGARPDTTCYDSGFYVLRNATCPAVLVETGYISCAPTAAHLRDPGYRLQVAQGIVEGLKRYVRAAPVRTARR